MIEMDDFAIANSNENYKVKKLIWFSKNLDKNDFLDSNYNIDKCIHSTKESREASTSGQATSSLRKEKKEIDLS